MQVGGATLFVEVIPFLHEEKRDVPSILSRCLPLGDFGQQYT
jgi:hypothetical protein